MSRENSDRVDRRCGRGGSWVVDIAVVIWHLISVVTGDEVVTLVFCGIDQNFLPTFDANCQIFLIENKQITNCHPQILSEALLQGCWLI